jgi:electron transfer flavoprotein beta subunit
VKVAVCVKHVPDGRMRIDASSLRVDRTGVASINAFDSNAVEEALRIKDAGIEAEVVVVTFGPEGAAETLRGALGLGADRAVLVSDPAAGGSDLLGTSRVLAAILKRETPDLVLFGQQAADGGGALLWAAVAERLRLPVVSQATQLLLSGTTARVIRQTERGDDVVEVPLPAVVAVTDAINEPRYASLKGQMAAKRKPLDRPGLADLGLDPSDVGDRGAGTVVLSLGPPPTRAQAHRIEDAEAAPAAILDFLVERQLV